MSTTRPSPPGQRQPGAGGRPVDEEPTRRVPVPTEEPAMAKAPTGAKDPFIYLPIKDDDEDAPTVARNLGPAAAASVAPALELPRRPTSTAPYSSLSGPPKAANKPTTKPTTKKPTTIPPPPPAAAFAPPHPPSFNAPSPPVPVFAPGGSSFTAPPPPPMPPSRSFPDSPFDPDMPTPPPPPTDEFAQPTPLPGYPISQMSGQPPGVPGLPPAGGGWAPALPSPGNSWAPGLNLQQPETIDFSADAQPLTIRRSGPPGLVVLIVLLGAMAGGAKLAHVVTRGDMAALDAASPAKPAQ